MSVIHLPDMRPNLILLRPILLRCLAVEVANTLGVVSSKKVHARLFVALYMERWDDPATPRHELGHIREVLGETGHDVDGILAVAVVRMDVINSIFFFTKRGGCCR
jgi:hypothetical protein